MAFSALLAISSRFFLSSSLRLAISSAWRFFHSFMGSESSSVSGSVFWNWGAGRIETGVRGFSVGG